MNNTSLASNTVANTVNNALIAETFNEANEILKAAGVTDKDVAAILYDDRLQSCLKLEDSAKLTSTVGKTILPRRLTGTYVIRFQRGLIDQKYKNDLLSVMIHELIHIIYPRENHGPAFKQACAKVNKIRPEINVTTTYRKEEREYQPASNPEKKKYTIMCPKCGKQWHFSRMSEKVKHPYRYLCANCHQELVRIK